MTQPEVTAFFRGISLARDRALFALIHHHGFRVSEVALLRRGDVDLDRGRLIVKRVKGGIWTERPLFASTLELLVPYLSSTTGDSEQPLFTGKRGPLRKRRIQALFEHYREKAGLAGHYTAHSLRHSIATHLLDAGLPLEFVQDHLGHKNIRSTTVYARITDRHRTRLFRDLESSPWIVHPTRESGQASPPKEKAA